MEKKQKQIQSIIAWACTNPVASTSIYMMPACPSTCTLLHTYLGHESALYLYTAPARQGVRCGRCFPTYIAHYVRIPHAG